MGAGAAADVCVWRAASARAGLVYALHDLAQHGEFDLASALESVEAGVGEAVAGTACANGGKASLAKRPVIPRAARLHALRCKAHSFFRRAHNGFGFVDALLLFVFRN